MTGNDPVFPAWEAGVLPLHYIRMCLAALITTVYALYSSMLPSVVKRNM